MATAVTTKPYYDIMIIGKTGMGKSTTADKLLIANPAGQNYLGEVQEDFKADGRNLRTSDFCFWCLGEKPKELDTTKARIKRLVLCRALEEPHVEIRNERGKVKQSVATGMCELISNETSMVRVLDVPGFFGKNDYIDSTSIEPDITGLCIVRNIIQIQTIMGLKFQRILYFLPDRDALERINDVLKKELKWMSHYFGEDIFKIMVLVATVSPKYSENPAIKDDIKFTQEDTQITLHNFGIILKEVFSESRCPVPPLIFLSLSETCESLLSKIQGAPVHCNTGMLLQFDTNTCANCGLRVGSKSGEKLACCFGEDWSSAVPYSETHCHPVFVPEGSAIKRIVNGIVYIFMFKWAQGVTWTEFVYVEVCARCRKKPGSQGCMRVGSQFDLKEQGKINVDHRSKVMMIAELTESG